MTFINRLAIILVWPVLAVVSIWYARSSLGPFGPEAFEQVVNEQKIMVGIVALYAVNFLIAWRYKNSWTVFVVRALFFGIVTFLCFDQLVYLIGPDVDRALATIIAKSGYEPMELAILRVQIFYWALGVAHGATAVALGFENKPPKKTQRYDPYAQ